MDRSRLKRMLLPYIVKHTLLGLIFISMVFIVLEMFQLVTVLSSHSHDEVSSPLGTEQVLFYIKNFFLLVLFGSLQTLGVYGVLVEDRNVLVAYVSSLVVAFVFISIDFVLLGGDNDALCVFYLFVQCLLTFAHVYCIQRRRSRGMLSDDNGPNIHYILMPKDQFAHILPN